MTDNTLTLLLLCATGLGALTINYTSKEICALRGSTVVLKCSYVLTSGDRFIAGSWHRNDSKISMQTNGLNGNRFVYNSQVCILRITNLMVQDSGLYQYKIFTMNSKTALSTSDRVTVHVTDVPRKDCWGVFYMSTSFCVLRGSTVDIPGSYGYPSDHKVTASFWYREVKKGEDPTDLRVERDYEGRVEYLSTEEHKSTLRISDVRETDSGEYRFRYTTDKPGGAFSSGIVTISATDLQVFKTPGTVTEGGKVMLTCNIRCNLGNDTTFIWYKNTQLTRHTNNTLHLNPVSSEDAGNYSCAVRGHEEYQSPENTLNVRYAPRNTVMMADAHAEKVEAASVTLTCSSDANPPVHNYTWYRKIGDELILIGAGQSYVIVNISYETSGLYYCVAHNSVGEQHSDVLSVPIAGQGSAKETAIGILIVVVLLLVLGLLWLRKRKSKKSLIKEGMAISQQADSSPVYDDVAAAAVTSDLLQRANTEVGTDVQYASIKFKSMGSAEMGLYANSQHHQTQKAQEDVQYASVKFSRPKDTSLAEADPVIYSAVNKPARTQIR